MKHINIFLSSLVLFCILPCSIGNTADSDLLAQTARLSRIMQRRTGGTYSHYAQRNKTKHTVTQRINNHWSTIVRAGHLYGVDPYLIHAVIMAESNYKSRAVSNKNAQGLMQLMPGTARELGVTNIRNSKQNIHAGTLYLRKMIHRFRGDLRKALWAYNAGPGNVEKNRISAETRRYAVKVLRIYHKTCKNT